MPRLRSSSRPLVSLGVLFVMLAHASAWAAPDTQTVLERRVKAAFLYKFAGYVDWPAPAFRGPGDPLVIGVIGDDALADELERLVQGRRSAGRLVQVRRIENTGEPGDVHLLFLGRSHAQRAGEAVQAIRQRPVLLVSESPGALQQGSMINFVIGEGRVRFEVDLDATKRNGLGLSSRLLTVARTVTAKGS
ncbi:MAG: YfiR family protein [Candidatus Eisenbacteria bacterium]